MTVSACSQSMYVVVCSSIVALTDITIASRRKKKIEEYIPTYKKGEICVLCIV